jgi:hypothetical protein
VATYRILAQALARAEAALEVRSSATHRIIENSGIFILFVMTRRHHSWSYLLSLLGLAVLCFCLGLLSRAEVKAAPAPPELTNQSTQAPAKAPAQSGQNPNSCLMDGAAGPCAINLKVIDTAGKPISSALISVHVAYGFGGFHKLDMSVYSSPEGKARFTGLPPKPKNAPLEFYGKKDNLAGVASMNPATECQAKHDLVMDLLKTQPK